MGTYKRYATFLTLLLPLSFAVPSVARAQQAQPAQQAQGPEVGDERLATYVKAFVEIARVRDELHQQFAQARNKTPEAQEALQEQMKERVSKTLEDNGMTQEEYNWITYVISSNQERREAFDRLMEASGTGT